MKSLVKILKYFLFLAVGLNFACSEKEIILSEDEIPDEVFYLKDEIKPFTGRCIVFYHGTEAIKEEMNFKDGMLDGMRISYYKSGEIKRQGSYKGGSLNGKWSGFDKDGNKTYEVEYQNDSLIGRFITWYSTGVIKQRGIYQNSRRAGEWIHYDEAGMIIKQAFL